MLALGSSCKCRLTLAEMFECTEAIINQSLADSYHNCINEWQGTIKLHLVAGFVVVGESMYFTCIAAPGGGLKSDSNIVLVHVCPTCCSIYHFWLFPPCCTLVSVTVLVTPQTNTSQNE